jgi:hypothetical protein
VQKSLGPPPNKVRKKSFFKVWLHAYQTIRLDALSSEQKSIHVYLAHSSRNLQLGVKICEINENV